MLLYISFFNLISPKYRHILEISFLTSYGTYYQRSTKSVEGGLDITVGKWIHINSVFWPENKVDIIIFS